MCTAQGAKTGFGDIWRDFKFAIDKCINGNFKIKILGQILVKILDK